MNAAELFSVLLRGDEVETGGTLQSKPVPCLHRLIEVLFSGCTHYKSPSGVILLFCCGFG